MPCSTEASIKLRALRDLLRVGPPATIGYSPQAEQAFRQGWNAGLERVWEHLRREPAFQAALDQMDLEEHEGSQA